MGICVENYISQQNYTLLKKNHPAVLEQLKKMRTQPTGEVDIGPTGKPNLKLIDGERVFYFHPEQDPDADRNHFLPHIKEDYSGVEVILGMGLGYGVKAILQQRKSIRYLVIIENDPGIFLQALKHMDLTDLLGDKRVVIGLAPKTPELVMEPVQKAILLEDTQILRHPGVEVIFKAAYDDIQKMVFSYVNKFNIAGATRVKFGEKIVKNRFEHLKSMGHCFLFESLLDSFKGIPAYIVAAGPSLDTNIKFLKKIQGRAVILCVDSALPSLIDNGITPDFVSSIDFQDLTYEKFSNKISQIPEYTGLLLFTATAPVIQKKFPGNRKFYLFADVGIDNWVNQLVNGSQSVASGPSVANLNFVAAKLMGCSPILFVGQDLCHSSTRTHSKSTVLTSPDTLTKTLNEGKGVIWVKNVDGDNVSTTRDFINIKDFFENLIKHNPGDYINCTPGGAHIEGTPYLPLEDAVERYTSDCVTIPRILEAVCSTENRIDSGLILSGLKLDIKAVDTILGYMEKAEQLLKKGQAELVKIRKKWGRSPELPKRVQTLLTDIDKVNGKIDNFDNIWRILEDITTPGLKKSEQMLFEIRKIEGVVQKYPDWLGKIFDRLTYVNYVRKEALKLFNQGMEEVVCYIEEEKLLLQKKSDDINTIISLAELYLSNDHSTLAGPQIKKYYDLDKKAAKANFFMGCHRAYENNYAEMSLFFDQAVSIDSGFEEKINQFRQGCGDVYLEWATILEEGNLMLAKRFLLTGITMCPFHEKIQGKLCSVADNDIKRIQAFDTDGTPGLYQDLIDEWLCFFNKIPQYHQFLSNESISMIYFFAGKLSLKSGEKEKAIIYFDKSISFVPENPELFLQIADLFLISLDYDQGVPHLQKAIELDPQYWVYWENFGDYLFKSQQFDVGVTAYEQALTFFPEDIDLKNKIIESWFQMGNQFHQKGEYEIAISIYEKAIQSGLEIQSPFLFHLHNNKGSALKHLGFFEKAMACYEKALAIAPDYPEALYNKGELLETLGENDSALSYYEKAIKQRPDFAVALQKMGALSVTMGQAEKAN